MLHFIVNSNMKNKDGFLRELGERLGDVPYAVRCGSGKEETRALAAELSREPADIVVVGGDGTLNDVLSGLSAPENVRLGLIPMGTGNDFAAAANIPKGFAALDLILGKEAVYTDFIDCGNGLRCMNIAGLGIDVDILERCEKKRGGRRSKYFFSLLASLFRYRGQLIELTVNGGTVSVNAFIAAVCNGNRFGGGIPICPPAEIGDGKLDLIVISAPAGPKIPFLLIKLMRGKILETSIANHILCEEATIVQRKGRVIQLDGELVESDRLTAKIVHNKLRMFRG